MSISHEPESQPLPQASDLTQSVLAVTGKAVGGQFNRVFRILFVVAFFANLMAVVTPLTISLSLKLLAVAPDQTANSLALILGVGAVFGAVANPVGGFFSDRSVSRFGRRRPYLIAGAVIGTAGLAVMGFAGSVFLLLVGWCVTQTGFNVVFAALYGLLADAFPAAIRGRISGFIGLAQAVGVAGGVGIATAFASNLALTFVIPGAVAILLLTVTAVIAPDRRLSRGEVESTSFVKFVTGFWVSPRKYPDYAWAWLGRFLMIFAQTGPSSFTVLFLISRLGFTAESVGGIVLINTLLGLGVQAIGSPLGGWLSDRLHRRKIFVFISALIFLVGILIITSATTLPVFLIGSAALQLGISAYVAVDLALVTDVLPDGGRQAGKHLGVLGLANTIPQSLAPAVAPAFLAIGHGGDNYPLFFLVCAGVSVLGAVSVFRIRSVR